MRKFFHSFLLLLTLSTSTALSQTSPPSPKPSPATKPKSTDERTYQTTLESLINSGKPEDMDEAWIMLKWRASRNPGQTVTTLKDLRNLNATLMRQPEHAQDFLDVIAAAKKKLGIRKEATGKLNSVGHIWALQIVTLYQMNKPQDAKAAYKEGVSYELNHQIAADIMKYWPLVYKNGEKQTEYLELLQLITQCAYEDDTIDLALRKRIDLLNTMKRPAEALADARRLFIMSAMPRTAEAILAFDKQLALAAPDKTTLFRKEQTDGAAAPAAPDSAADAHKSSVLLDITIDNKPDPDALTVPGDGTSVDTLLHPAMVYLLCGQPDEALKIIRQAAQETTDTAEAARVIALTAKAFKAQDGTVGRANAYLAAKHPTPALPPRPSQKKPAINLPDTPRMDKNIP